MAFIRSLFISILYILLYSACDSHSGEISTAISTQTVSNRVLDSLGELAYAEYKAYSNDPETFLAPLEDKILTPNQQETYLWILLNMAYGFQEHNRILQSSDFYEKALLYDNVHHILDLEDRLTYLYKPLANNYTILSDYGKAERLQLIALEEAHVPLTKASFCNNLTLLYTYKGEVEKSKHFGLMGLDFCSESPYLCIMLHNSLSNNYTVLGHTDSAKWHNQQALNLLDPKLRFDTGSTTQLAIAHITAYSQQGSLLAQDKQPEEARKTLVQALKLEKEVFPTSRFREKAALYNKLGSIDLAGQNWPVAESYFHKGLSLYEQENQAAQSATYTKITLLKNIGVSKTLAGKDSVWHYFRKAVEADFAYQQGVTTKESHLRNNYWNRELLEEIFDITANIPLDQDARMTLLWMTELTKARLLWNDIHRSEFWAGRQAGLEDAAAQLRLLYAKRDRTQNLDSLQQINLDIDLVLAEFELEEQYFSKNITFPSYEAFQARLRIDPALIYSYFLHSDESVSIFISDGGEVSYQRQQSYGLKDTINNFKRDYFSTTPHNFNTDPQTYFTRSEKLRQVLLPQLEPVQIMHPRDLKLSLDNELFTLPFDALSVDKRFLVQDFNVQYVHSVLTDRLHPVREFSADPIHILYRGQYDPPMPNLQFVEAEVDGLDRRFLASIFPAEALSPEALHQALDHKGIIHIAAHAVLDDNMEASLLLDQPISTDQLRYYNMKAPLVVLSACNTASGQLLLSEGLESINRTFLSKGVQGVIANHWFANDDTMLDLTDKFYTHLASTKRPVLALAEAKRQYLIEQSEPGRNPWYWANMAYMGTDTKIDLQQSAGLSIRQATFILLGVLSLFILTYSFWRIRQARAIKSARFS